MKHLVTWLTLSLLGIALVFSAACSKGSQAASAPEPLEVAVAPVLQRDVPIYSEWIGTLDGMVNADIKAQVSGYLMKQDYTEGSFVKTGQLLFQIDPRPFRGGAGSGQRTARAGVRAIGASQRAAHSGPGAGGGGRSKSSKDATGCGSLCPAGKTASHYAAGHGQRHAE